jgi:hypothetical protein
MIAKPNFFIVGAAKAGTTSLYYYLKGHPEVYMCPVKEPNFFSFEEVRDQNLYYKVDCVDNLRDYEKLFIEAAGKKAVGESSVSYIFYPQTPLKIKKLIPDAKIIIMLRDPSQRGFSHYLMDKRLGYVDLSFEDIIYKRAKHPLLDLYYQQYVELGLYYEQVKRYLDIWDTNRVKFILTSDLNANPNYVLREICQFLEIDQSFSFDTSEQHNVYELPKAGLVTTLYASSKIRTFLGNTTSEFIKKTIKKQFFSKGQKPRMNQNDSEYLRAFYKEDIKNLEKLLKIELVEWYDK